MMNVIILIYVKMERRIEMTRNTCHFSGASNFIARRQLSFGWYKFHFLHLCCHRIPFSFAMNSERMRGIECQMGRGGERESRCLRTLDRSKIVRILHRNLNNSLDRMYNFVRVEGAREHANVI